MDKMVFVKELRTGTTKSNKNYPIVIDQDNKRWNIWLEGVFLELQKAYLFTFEMDNEFERVTKIIPLVNVLHQKALKEVASRNEVFRNLSVCYSYAHDYVNNGTLEMAQVNDKAMEIYNFLTKNADELMPKLEE